MITLNHYKEYKGGFDTEDDAARMYDRKSICTFGLKAKTNFDYTKDQVLEILKELSQEIKDNLVSELAKLPFAFSLICYVDNMPAGLVNCFTLFSTFKCKPVVNVHDLIVDRSYRRKGISQLLLGEVEKIAKQKGACKITLEVLEKNHPARNSYQKFGFTGYELKPEYGNAIFLEKAI